MQINYRFLKKILNIMQTRQSHYISVQELMEDVRGLYPDTDKEEYTDLFFGHLYLLKDNEVVKELSETNIRLTSKGYDFAKVLNKNEILEKLKRFTLNEALHITNAVIANSKI